MKKISDLSYSFFFNGERGLEVLKFFKKNKFKNLNLFISKRNIKKNTKKN